MFGGTTRSSAAMPAGAVEDDEGMGAGCDGPGEMQVHRRGVGARQDKAGADAPLGADGAEDVGPLVAGVAHRAGPRPAPGLDPGGGGLLADPRFVLEPDFHRLARGRRGEGLGYRGGEFF